MLTPSRRAVATTLIRVLGEGKRVPDGWDRKLSGADAGLAQAMLGLVLRRWGRLRAWSRPHLADPSRDLPLGTDIALAMGLAQLAWLDGVAPHAAVHESVNLVADPELGFPPHRGLVNAILRKASKDRAVLKAELEALPASLDRGPFAEKLLAAATGPTEADPEALWARLQVPPKPAFVPLREEPLPEGMEPDPEVAGAFRLQEGAPFPLAWLQSGAGMVQDRSSQALMAFTWPKEPQRILDVCAAPGGKATVLGRRWPAAKLMALEQQAARAERLKENLAARRVEAEVQVTEATAWLAGGGRPFDLILLDAPCSGSGTLQKHPELPWIGDGIDLRGLVLRQRQLLEAAALRLAPGGLLIYAVCSWLPEEGEAHRVWIQARVPGLRPVAVWEGPCAAEGGVAFRPHPLTWQGEGFQGFAFTKD